MGTACIPNSPYYVHGTSTCGIAERAIIRGPAGCWGTQVEPQGTKRQSASLALFTIRAPGVGILIFRFGRPVEADRQTRHKTIRNVLADECLALSSILLTVDYASFCHRDA